MSEKFTRTRTGLRRLSLSKRRAVVVGPPPVVVEEYPYPFYAAPPVYAAPYAAPPVYAYAGPGWRGGWGHRRYFGGRW